MTQETYDIWNTIKNVKMSNDGDWVIYNVEPGKGDPTLIIYNTRSGEEKKIHRAHSPSIDYNNQFVQFKISPHEDSIRNLKLKKVKKEKLPKDTIGIYNFTNSQLTKLADIRDVKMPEKYGSYISFMAEDKKKKDDSTLVKNMNGKNGRKLILHDFSKSKEHVFEFVKDITWAEKKPIVMIHTTGNDSINKDQIIVFDIEKEDQKIISNVQGEFYKFNFSKSGDLLSFLVNQDTTKLKPEPYDLFIWKKGNKVANKIADNNSEFIPENWSISKNGGLNFSDDNQKLLFGIAPTPLQKDTTLLEEEMAVVEIWNHKDPLLYTQQNIRAKREKERQYRVQYDLQSKRFTQINHQDNPEIRWNNKLKSEYYLTFNEQPYQQNITWLGYAFKDVYLTNSKTGQRQKIANKIQGNTTLSPSEKYVYWYSRPDTSWYTYNINSKKTTVVTHAGYYDELNDRPMHPYPAGLLGWTKNDASMLIYDFYDVWKIDPNGKRKAINLTNGRNSERQFRHVRLDRDIEFYPEDTTLLLKVFDTQDKTSGYAYLNLKTGNLDIIEEGKYVYTTRILKAKHADDIIFTKENFETFPDLIHSNTSFENQKRISNANPQQSEYAWGSIELVSWKDFDGIERQGLLVKPPNFDPNKKYPLMVNFYEKSSNRLYNHRAPYPHRSTINYTYWANKGYLIFNPDVYYKNGYPGKSCYDAVVSGTQAMIKKGFIDESKIGVQGHSWGGYQIAHLLTKTDMFACAEAGAPVVNMTSAYGGIRWGSGMSRMFQYERTQSRIGATLWEDRDLYLENSPLFNLDKHNTPVLILHNDKDGAVPWYQGIEYFVGLRRLGKPAWMLNYNDEPHWPLKRPNRLDFNKRLEQFFDHYLMDASIPEWMDKGVPAVEKGLNYGFELLEKP